MIGKSYTPDQNAPDLLFGQFLCVGGDIAWIMDTFIDDEMIDECKKHDIFLKKAKFEVVLNCEAKYDINGVNFEGTFIDALKYIQKFQTE